MNKSKIIKSFVFSTLLFLGISNVNALTGTINNSVGANFRKTPSSEEDNVIKALPYNTKVTLENTDKFEGPGCDEKWYKVTYDNQEGYVCSLYVTVNNTTSSSGSYFTTSGYEARVAYSIVSVRKSASSSSTLKDRLMYGESIKILSSSNAGNGCSDKWYKISYHNNKTGYMCSSYINKYSDIVDTDYDEKDTEFCKTLTEAGFPSSYCPYLVKIHNTHPTWTFKPVITNLKWASVVKNESGKNYITKLIDDKSYLESTKLLDGGAWYELKDSVNAFYLDPRNFLNDVNIFMFQTLTFNEKDDTKENLKKILGGTDLNKESILESFINSGKKNNVSALHAAARVVQEGVTSNEHEGLSGKSTLKYRKLSLKGYYNLFNIGAYQDSYTTNPVARGLAFACGAVNGSGTFDKCGTYKSYARPWNSIDAAINGGMNFLGEDYISVGQYTLYFQKFNTANSKIDGAASNYTHQYMTNIQAPLEESDTMYEAYNKMGVLNTAAFTFSIPVYKNMPEEIITLPPVGDSVNTLSSLKVNDELLAGFDSDVITYTKYVPYETESVNITATPSSSLATVTGTGEIKLTEENTTIEIIVTSETNEEKIYKITIIKTKESEMKIEDLLSKLDIKINNDYIYITKPGTSANTLLNNISKQSSSATLLLKDKNGKTKTTGSLATSDTIKITMLSKETKTLTIIVLGDTNGDAKVDILDLLRIQKHILKSSKLKADNLEASDTNLDDKTDILDLLRLQKYILKSIKEFK